MPYVKVDGKWVNSSSSPKSKPDAAADEVPYVKPPTDSRSKAYVKVDGKWTNRSGRRATSKPELDEKVEADKATSVLAAPAVADSKAAPPSAALQVPAAGYSAGQEAAVAAIAELDSKPATHSDSLEAPAAELIRVPLARTGSAPVAELIRDPLARTGSLPVQVVQWPEHECQDHLSLPEGTIPQDLQEFTKTRCPSAGISIEIPLGFSSPNSVSGAGDFKTCGVTKKDVVSEFESSDFVDRFYDVKEELGNGAYGKVKLVVDRRSELERVCKFVDTSKIPPATLAMMEEEVETLVELDHPSVVKIFEHAFDEDKGQLVIVLEYLRGGDGVDLLDQAEKDGTPLPEAFVGTIVQQALKALCYCHSQGVVHRDLKPENLMLTERGSSDSSCLCKLVDFGASAGLFGTAEYMAPEVAALAACKKTNEVKECSGKSDIWSLGVTALELLMDKKPFDHHATNGDGATFAALAKYTGYSELQERYKGEKVWNERSSEVHSFLETVLVADPNKRPTAAEALQHPWMLKHSEIITHLTPAMVQSLADYPSSPPWVRCCLFVIATRCGVQDPKNFGRVYLSLDKDGDGIIDREEFGEALRVVEGGDTIDVEAILDAADLDHNGGIDFTEFLAVCSFVDYAEGSLENLMVKAFYALDDDRDDMLRVSEISAAFRESDAPLLQSLPQDMPFGIDEWVFGLESMEEY